MSRQLDFRSVHLGQNLRPAPRRPLSVRLRERLLTPEAALIALAVVLLAIIGRLTEWATVAVLVRWLLGAS